MAVSLMAGPVSQALQALECFERERYETYKPRPLNAKHPTASKEEDEHYINELDLRKILS